MRTISLLFVIACGGKASAPAPVENTAPASAEPARDGTIRVVQRGSDGGVIELAGDRSAAMAAADKEMASVCGENSYTITQEGEEAIMPAPGEDVVNRQSTETRTATAWRVHYQCSR